MTDAMPEETGREAAAADAGWTADLGEHAGLVAAKGWKSPADVVKSYAHLERLVGNDRIPYRHAQAWSARRGNGL